MYRERKTFVQSTDKQEHSSSLAAVLKQHKVAGCAEIKHNLAASTDFASAFDRPLKPIGYSRIAGISG